MKKKYVVSAITLALLGISSDQNGSSRMVVNAATTKAQAQVEAKATATAKVEAKAESKSTAKASAAAEVEDFFSQPFEQVLAQSTSYEDSMQDTSFDKMPTEGIDLGGLKGKVEEAIKPVTDNIDEKDKQAMKEQAKEVGGDLVKKPLEVMNTAGKVVNSPEAHIVAKAAGGQEGEAKLKQTQDVVNKANDIVGNAKARFQMMALDQFPNFDQINQMSMDPNQGQQNPQQESGFDMPIVSQIQALDQYGNVIASAQNPKMEQYLKRQRNQQPAGGFAPQPHPQQLQQPQLQQQQLPQPQPQAQPHQVPQFNQMPQNFMGFQQQNMMPMNNNNGQAPGQQMQMQNQQQQAPPQPHHNKKQQHINNQAPQFANNAVQQQQMQQQEQREKQVQQQQQIQPQQPPHQSSFAPQPQPPKPQQPQAPPKIPQQAVPQNSMQQDFDYTAGLLQQHQGSAEKPEQKKEQKHERQQVEGSSGQEQKQQQQMSQCTPSQGRRGDQQQQMGQQQQDFTPYSQSPFQTPFMNDQQQQMFFQQQMGGFGHMQPPQMPMMNGGMFMPPTSMPQQFTGPLPQNPYMFQMQNMMPQMPYQGGMGGNSFGQQQQPFNQQQQQLAAMQSAPQQHQPFDTQLVQNNQDVHTGAVPQEILDLENGHQKMSQAGSRGRRTQQQHANGLSSQKPPQPSSGKQSRPHDVTNLQTKDFFMQGPYGYGMWQPSMFPQMYSYYYPQQQLPGQFSQVPPSYMPNYYFGQMGGAPGAAGMNPQYNRLFQQQINPMSMPQGFNSNPLATQNLFRNMPNQQLLNMPQKQFGAGTQASQQQGHGSTQWGNMQMPLLPQPTPFQKQQVSGGEKGAQSGGEKNGQVGQGGEKEEKGQQQQNAAQQQQQNKK